MLKNNLSSKLWAQAQKYIAGGVNSPVRAFVAVGGKPIFMEKGIGPLIYDVDGNSYIDYVMSWGPLILGHSHPSVIKAIKNTSLKGTTFGAPTQSETKLAEIIIKAIPSVEKIRFTSSGTEAVMSAVRLARGFTQREKIIKFAGCYHGHSDSLLVKAGSGLATLGRADSLGIPRSLAQQTMVLPYNQAALFKKAVDDNYKDIAAVIVEPVAGNMGVVLPEDNFLPMLRSLTQKHNIILIFDEVITGFRLNFGGAQNLFKIKPDLTVLGKIIGGGLPVGAFGGRKEIMDLLAPKGGVYQAGTLSGNPLAMSAGIATLKILSSRRIYKELAGKTKFLAGGINKIIKQKGIKARVSYFGSMLTLFCHSPKTYARFFHNMLERKVYLPPSQFEAWFVSAAHSKKDIEYTLDAIERSI